MAEGKGLELLVPATCSLVFADILSMIGRLRAPPVKEAFPAGRYYAPLSAYSGRSLIKAINTAMRSVAQLHCPRAITHGGHGRTAPARSPIARRWSTSGGSMRSTRNDTERRASTSNCAPRAKSSVASASSGSCGSPVSGLGHRAAIACAQPTAGIPFRWRQTCWIRILSLTSLIKSG
jgi:hypothetical protein